MSVRTLASSALLLAAGSLSAQARSDFKWEKTLPARSDVVIRNIAGSVSVKPSTSGKVEITGIKRGNTLLPLWRR